MVGRTGHSRLQVQPAHSHAWSLGQWASGSFSPSPPRITGRVPSLGLSPCSSGTPLRLPLPGPTETERPAVRGPARPCQEADTARRDKSRGSSRLSVSSVVHRIREWGSEGHGGPGGKPRGLPSLAGEAPRQSLEHRSGPGAGCPVPPTATQHRRAGRAGPHPSAPTLTVEPNFQAHGLFLHRRRARGQLLKPRSRRASTADSAQWPPGADLAPLVSVRAAGLSVRC